MSGPTRQRSLRERLHGISIPWQGKKSKTFHSKEEQALAESESKPGSLDSRSCDPIPSSGEEEKGLTASTNVGSAAKDSAPKSSSSPPSTKSGDTQAKSEDKSSATKEQFQVEKRLLHRSFTQPKGTEEYQVKASDTLASVAARFDTTPSELAKLNKLSARMIFPGQLLFVPEKKNVANKDPSSQSETGNNTSPTSQNDKSNGDQGGSASHGNNNLGVHDDNSSIPKRKVSVTDALRIPYRRHSDRLQRFLKVKARHFTDGQGVVAGVLIITPNAVMFDPNVSDPLVIEHGIESYGVIAPLDMVMRTAIYFDIAHMKVKNAPEAPLNIPKPDIYYGKMNATNSKDEGSANDSLKTNKTEDSKIQTSQNSGRDEETQSKENDKDQEKGSSTTQDDNEIKMPQTSKSHDALASSHQGPNQDTEVKKETLSREGSLDKEVIEAFANQEPSKKVAPTTPNNSIDSPTPPLSAGAVSEDRPIPESRRERMLKRLSYPMESITSYTQSSLSRILSSSPKSFVDGLFVKDEKNKEELHETDEEGKPSEDEQPAEKEAEEDEVAKPSSEKRLSTSLPEPPAPQNSEEKEKDQNSKLEAPSVGYKNLVEEKPEVFEIIDKLLRQNAVQEQEGPPLYLCLRMGHPKKKHTQMTPILSYGKKKAKSEYWFSIPYNRVEDMYNFLQQWFPHLYGDVDEKDPEELGFVPIDDTVEDEPEEEEQKEKSAEEGAEGEGEKRSTPMSFLKLVEDHFGFRSISPTDWEVLSMGESDHISFSDLELPLPELLTPSEILEEDHIKELYVLLPARVVGHNWIQLFSTATNGFNLKTLYRLVAEHDSPMILVIKDTEEAVFGAILTTALRISDHFYGSGESLLYTFHPEFKVFRWTGSNMYFIKGNMDSIAIGAGEGEFGLWIDGDLNHGRSQRCLTFDNDILSKSSDFIVKSLEVWGFV